MKPASYLTALSRGAPSGNRTHDPPIKGRLLCQSELWRRDRDLGRIQTPSGCSACPLYIGRSVNGAQRPRTGVEPVSESPEFQESHNGS